MPGNVFLREECSPPPFGLFVVAKTQAVDFIPRFGRWQRFSCQGVQLPLQLLQRRCLAESVCNEDAVCVFVFVHLAPLYAFRVTTLPHSLVERIIGVGVQTIDSLLPIGDSAVV